MIGLDNLSEESSIQRFLSTSCFRLDAYITSCSCHPLATGSCKDEAISAKCCPARLAMDAMETN